MSWWMWLLAAWLPLSAAVGLVVGRAMRRADQREGEGRVFDGDRWFADEDAA
ncbi:hypothetical protein SAMN05660748_1025 [Blastococcus aggregatus]|uniref:Uncharacterized protein n=1 Tax=Blastococcus aggregatus TaxID=38502 RepID=A0A285V1H5_9ACTN|nr:hypothetical protein [Blastococcus aggregatus]SOC47767.1 hypothetical protein SAMN05660748_1025 [Blastococcus aggregatus]